VRAQGSVTQHADLATYPLATILRRYVEVKMHFGTRLSRTILPVFTDEYSTSIPTRNSGIACIIFEAMVSSQDHLRNF
jgi:hypothetical protein